MSAVLFTQSQTRAPGRGGKWRMDLLEDSFTMWALQLLVALVNLGGSFRPTPTSGPDSTFSSIQRLSRVYNLAAC